jgi:predicted ATP-dependent serine protease
MTTTTAEFQDCLNCGKQIEYVMGSCRNCGAERPAAVYNQPNE